MPEYDDSHPRPIANPVIDPTVNVKDALREAVARFDALREADRRYAEAEIRRINDLMDLRGVYAEKLEVAEAKRIDAIRAVDVNAIAIANERATAQATVLANQVVATADTLRSLVSTTAAAQKAQLDQTTSQLSERLSSLEKLQYEGKGLSGTVPAAVSERLAQLEESKFRGEGRGTLSGPLMMLLASLGGGLVIFLVQQFMR